MAEEVKQPIPEVEKIGVDIAVGEARDVSPPPAHLQRKLGGKEVQLFAIGGAIGTSRQTHATPYTSRPQKLTS